jgi:hypothetical protein
MTIPAPAAPRSAAAAALAAFGALLARDLAVLRRQPADFLTRTIVQPVLFVFVLGYVSRRIGQPAAGSATQTATTLLAGMLAIVILFRGPVRRDPAPGAGSRLRREIDDRLLAPLPAIAWWHSFRHPVGHRQDCAARIPGRHRRARRHTLWHRRAAPGHVPPWCGNVPSRSGWPVPWCRTGPRGQGWRPQRIGRCKWPGGSSRPKWWHREAGHRRLEPVGCQNMIRYL